MFGYVKKTKEYYEAMAARFTAYVEFVKLAAFIGVLCFAGWHAAIKMVTSEVKQVVSDATQGISDVQDFKSSVMAPTPRPTYSINVLEKQREELYRFGGRPVLSLRAPIMVTEHVSLSSRMYGSILWGLAALLFAYLAIQPALYHYRKLRGQGGNTPSTPRTV